jgi:hypothetical protein
MVKCPFCHFDNEEGALFCEQCKSDLAGVPSTQAPEPLGLVFPPPPADVLEAVPVVAVADETPVVEAALVEPFTSAPPLAEAIPVEALTPIPLAPEMPASPSPFDFLTPVVSPPVEVAPPEVTPVPEVVTSAPPAPPVVPSAPVAAPPAPAPQDAPITEPSLAPPSAPAAVPAAVATATPAPTPTAAAPAAQAPGAFPLDVQPRLIVLRGLKRNVEYPLYEGLNFIGRADEKPVDIDLDDQEPPDRVWSSRQHALVTFEQGKLVIEDLNSSNGTFVNRARIYPGQKRELAVNDVIQIGTVQMKLII